MSHEKLYKPKHISLISGLFTLILILLISCGPTSDKGVEKIVPTGDEKYLTLDSDYIFDQNMLHTFEIRLPKSSLEKIDANPAAEEYIEGRLIFDGETISPVGIRYKGSVGAFIGGVSGTDWANPSGYKTATKLSLKVKINWDGSDATFYGLKKLQFHSQNHDYTQLHERLGYWLFREMGVPAPRSVHARIIINGTYYGVYALTEQVDGRFTRYNFFDGSGNLYKEIWPLSMYGQPQQEHVYIEHLKTNEDEQPTVKIIKSFAQAIAGSNPDTIQSVIEKWMDVDTIMAFIAVDRAIRADDGPFHWYADERGTANHNYYWYEEPNEERLYLIPWDLDNAFENIITDLNQVTAIADEWGEVTAGGSPFPYGKYEFWQRSAAADKLTAGWVSYESEYREALERLLKGPLSETEINSLIDAWIEQIREATLEAEKLYDDALSFSLWEQAVAHLKTSMDYARKKLEKQIQSTD
jgi:spore coat protein CotH